ncbi:MAG: hypothetical protein JOZ80_09940 [Acidobacteriaceae bacterium]|nr:hypothetical protein [Acidobacteriaceae bacterium]
MKKEKRKACLGRSEKGKRKTPKRKGEVAEAAFLSKATELGFDVAKPWGDSSPFDFIVCTGLRCWRVQVKAAWQRRGKRFEVRCSGNRHITYTKDEIDFLVAYIVPEKLWYVVPVEGMAGLAALWLCPRPESRSRFEIYREAWCLMACPRDGECSPEILVRRGCAEGTGKCRFGRGEKSRSLDSA